MARQRANLIEDTDPPVEPVTETITYIPGEQDKPQVTWGGHTFQANVPKTITGHAEGSNQERINHHLIESARNNKHFQVGGTKKKRDASALPETAEQYRAYMVDWLQGSFDHADELIQRFARDRDLRDRCDVGSDDYSYLATLFMPRLHELARGDDLNDLQVSAIWARNGFNVLPW
jgi:hypothetical protein